MRFATFDEIEYLGKIAGDSSADPYLIREMAQRLDALRRFDQSFCDADYRPHAGNSDWQLGSPILPR